MRSNNSGGLSRFVDAQDRVYDEVLSELRSGRKTSHWMWFIFPQFAGLGSNDVSRFYAIRSIDEAHAYLQHPILGPRLIEGSEAILALTHRSAHEIFGSPDDMKLKSCMTLFASISPVGSVFEKVLDHYYEGKRDGRTLQLIKDKTS